MPSQPSKSRGSTPLFMMIVAFFGLFLVAMLTFNPPVTRENLAWRKPMIGSMFASVCVLGIIAVFYPNRCSRAFDLRSRERRRSRLFGFNRVVSVSENNVSALRGHHPRCGNFSSHVFRIGDKIFCATCSGLFLGAVVVLVGVAFYFFGNWQTGQHALSMVWVGILGVTLGLLQPPLLNVHRSMVRVFSGALLAVGAFLILVGIDELAHNLFSDVFLVFLTVFWLMTRISLSQWEHEKTCSMCGLAFCELAEQTETGV